MFCNRIYRTKPKVAHLAPAFQRLFSRSNSNIIQTFKKLHSQKYREGHIFAATVCPKYSIPRNNIWTSCVSKGEASTGQRIETNIFNKLQSCEIVVFKHEVQNDLEEPVSIIDAKYVDTAYECNTRDKNDMPTALLVHGTPGSYENLYTLVEPLVDRGYRVLSICMPGSKETTFRYEGDALEYNHSPMENLQFLVRFLDELAISRLDMIIGHSAGCFASTLLAAKSSLVKSVLFINPGVGHKKVKGMQPYWFFQMTNYFWKHPLFHKLAAFIVKSVSSKRKFKNVDHSVTQMAACLSMCCNIDFDSLPGYAIQVGNIKGIPMVFCCSANDNYIDLEDSLEYADFFGIERDNFESYDEMGNLSKEATATNSNFQKGIIFEKGGHFPLRKEQYAKILVDQAMELCDHLESQESKERPESKAKIKVTSKI